jgi:hypothetical protein
MVIQTVMYTACTCTATEATSIFRVQIKTQRMFSLAFNTLLVSVMITNIIFNSRLGFVRFFSFALLEPDPYLEYTSDLDPGVKMVYLEKGY